VGRSSFGQLRKIAINSIAANSVFPLEPSTTDGSRRMPGLAIADRRLECTTNLHMSKPRPLSLSNDLIAMINFVIEEPRNRPLSISGT
jgi:hypothetical protein